jgi:ABC-2 type transport system permease protein
MRTIVFLVWKEYLHVIRDRATLFQVLAIPMVQLVVLGFAATFAIGESDVYLVDLDRSTASRSLAANFAASESFRIVDSSASAERADRALVARDATVILRIPADFERDLATGQMAAVQIIIDAEQGATAGILRSYASRIITNFGARSDVAYSARREATVDPGRPTGPIEIRARGWYNPDLDYSDYMVPGILVALVTLIGTLLTAQNIAREKELGTLEQLNVTPLTRTQFIAGKLIPFWMLGMGELIVGLALARVVFDIPLRGNLLLVLAFAGIYLVAALALGLLISTAAETQQQAMFVTFFVMMIYLLLGGLYTPVTSIPADIRWLAETNPIKHFVYVMRAMLVKGAGVEAVINPVLTLAGFAIALLALAIRRYSKRIA